MASVLILLMALVRTSMALSQCTELDQLTSVQQGKRLTGYTFLSLDIDGVMQCAQACLNRKRCKSFNLLTTFGQCELNLHTGAETGGLTSVPSFIYSDIDQWTQVISGECESHTCNYSQICQPSLVSMCSECTNATQCGACYPVTEVSGQQFRSYGCHKSEPTLVLPHLLADFTPVDYNNITKTVLECAAAAVSSGYGFFGIQNFGVCYGGHLAEANFQFPIVIGNCATMCWGGVGKGNIMFVHQWI